VDRMLDRSLISVFSSQFRLGIAPGKIVESFLSVARKQE
jgi:hypothetical protein